MRLMLPYWLVTIFLVTSCLGFEWKRAPPFSEPNAVNNKNVHLGNYTHSHEDVEAPTYTCTPIGECDVCTPLEKKTMPHCMEYGNKEPVRCEWDDPDFAPDKNATLDPDSITLPAFRGCPHVKRIERWKTIRFESVNFVVAVLAVIFVFWRQRKLAREQYQRLAQRIGVATA
ncbi:hypothetical protein BCR43DRAFT_490555 [Syncephalastrum racemosum]|uniref:Protein JTB n=1 Tax=Syncephalastrum racemosum TaxID=13706 RepID=A0A1X2HG93_SYNRA|nr:hypothetical protein BCR43DRAFT_490555 [Syncephalastrum racemosum]